MPSKNCKRKVTFKDIALLFGFRYLKVAPRFVFMIHWKKKILQREERSIVRGVQK